MLAWTEQVKCRGLSEQPNYNRVATKPCNMKLVIGITVISVNHNSSIYEVCPKCSWTASEKLFTLPLTKVDIHFGHVRMYATPCPIS